MSLPPEFTSLYRLFLRATSAAVLNNAPATRWLRRLYRPSFEAAAASVRRLEKVNPKGRGKEARNVGKWLRTFDPRINNTLSFLHNSSHSRGLPSKVVNNLFRLSRSNYPWTSSRVEEAAKCRQWNPKLDPKSPEYSTMPPTLYSTTALRNDVKREREMALTGKCWGGLGDVIQMAEATDGLVLGKVRFKMQKFNKNNKYF